MPLTDRVAEYIHRSHQSFAKRNGNISVRDLFEYTKHTTKHEHPRTDMLMVCYRLKVGDVLQPITETINISDFDSIRLSPLSKLVIYQTSWDVESQYYPAFPNDDKVRTELKTIVLVYEHPDMNINLNDIKGVICTVSHFSIVMLLENSRYLGNIADRLD